MIHMDKELTVEEIGIFKPEAGWKCRNSSRSIFGGIKIIGI